MPLNDRILALAVGGGRGAYAGVRASPHVQLQGSNNGRGTVEL